MSDLIGGLVFKGLRKLDSKRIIVIPNKDMSHHITGYRMDKYKFGIMKQQVDLTDDEDPTDEDGETRMGDLTGVSVSLGDEISLEGKESRESNIGDSDNTRDGGKTAGKVVASSLFRKCSGTEDIDGKRKLVIVKLLPLFSIT
ncbi:hypothetical protein Tco_1308800, partial [Tanacetum coccineum]